MIKKASRLTVRWQAPLESRVWRTSSPIRRVFELDVNGDGWREVCLQIDDRFIALSGSGVVQERTSAFVAPLPRDSGGAERWVEAEGGGDLVVRTTGRSCWTRALGVRRFSFIGEHRDYEGDLSRTPYRGLGSYVQEHRVVELAVVPGPAADQPDILVVFADGRAMQFSIDGLRRWSRVLLPGSLSAAAVLAPDPAITGNGRQIVVHADCQSVRRLGVFSQFKHDPVLLLLDGGKVIDKRWRMGLSHRVPGQPGRYVVVDTGDSVDWRGRELLPGPPRRRSERGQIYAARDVSDPYSAFELVKDLRRGGGVMARVPSGDELWTLPWPADAVRVSDITASVANVRGTQLAAVLLEFHRQLVEYNTTVAVYEAVVVRSDGSVLARQELDARSLPGLDASSFPFITDLDRDGQLQLVVVTPDVVGVWDVDGPSAAAGDPLAAADSWNEEGLDLPPEDLWSLDLLHTANGEKL